MPYKDPAMQKARRRNRDHVRRSAVSDITAAQELSMRSVARKCPLCGVRLTDTPNLPNSKHLDHILPIGVGGTHTHGNVRIICLACNVRRPRDGSDFTGTLTLWAENPAAVAKSTGRAMCGKGLHSWVPENVEARADGKSRCKECRKDYQRARDRRTRLRECQCGAAFAAPGRTAACPACVDAAARKAAELHATGLTWAQVAPLVGYGSAWGAAYAARRAGYVQAS